MWHYFPDHYMFSYQVNRMLSQSTFGGGDFGEILEAASGMTAGDFESFHREWLRIGERARLEADEAMEKGHRHRAKAAYLRAANYFRCAEFFLVPQDERKMQTYLKSIDSFRKGASLLDRPPRLLQIPFEGSYLPGYFYPAPGSEKAPAVIMFGGLDSTAEELYFGPAQLLNERGISFLAVDGPGQGGALRLNHIRSRHDYNVAATAVFDYAVQELPVDPERIGVMAVSMGGYMAARSAAFEPRFKACAIWSAVYSYYEVWANRPDNHPLSRILLHILDAKDMAEAREKLRSFTLENVAEKISMPTYIIHGEDDRQVPVSHAYRVYEKLKCPKTLVIVPKDSIGSAHCQVDGVTKTFPMYDWLQEQLMR